MNAYMIKAKPDFSKINYFVKRTENQRQIKYKENKEILHNPLKIFSRVKLEQMNKT